MRRILVNEFVSSWRRRWNDERPSEVLPEVATADHGDAVTDRSTLVAALALLPRRQRAVVVLRFFHDYSEAMTADALGVTVGTVKSQTSKALVHPAGESRPARSGRPRGGPLHQRAEEPAISHTLDALRGALAEAVDGVVGLYTEGDARGHRPAPGRGIASPPDPAWLPRRRGVCCRRGPGHPGAGAPGRSWSNPPYARSPTARSRPPRRPAPRPRCTMYRVGPPLRWLLACRHGR